MKLGESLEDYLETLLILEETGKIRCVDVASRMHVSKPSVNKAMNVLKEKGYVLQESYGDIHLTDAGSCLLYTSKNRHQRSHSVRLFQMLYDDNDQTNTYPIPLIPLKSDHAVLLL